jgi:hypothetical protein
MIWRELEKPVAFVLGGGGSLGAMQVGMLEALAEHAIVPDLVVGTSVGAINGAILAADPQGAAHRLAHSWSRLDPSRVVPRSVIGTLRARREQHNHLVSASGLARILIENLPSGASFDHLAVPLKPQPNCRRASPRAPSASTARQPKPSLTKRKPAVTISSLSALAAAVMSPRSCSVASATALCTRAVSRCSSYISPMRIVAGEVVRRCRDDSLGLRGHLSRVPWPGTS